MRGFALRRASRAVAGWSAVLLIAACGGETRGSDAVTGPGMAELAGDYALVGLNGATVPATVQPDDCELSRWVNGRMTLAVDGSWQMELNWTDDGNNPQVLRDNGRYRVAGRRLSFQSNVFGDQFDGAVDGAEVLFFYDFCDTGRGDLHFAFSQ
jgi:hypothetical protein